MTGLVSQGRGTGAGEEGKTHRTRIGGGWILWHGGQVGVTGGEAWAKEDKEQGLFPEAEWCFAAIGLQKGNGEG